MSIANALQTVQVDATITAEGSPALQGVLTDGPLQHAAQD